MEETPYLDALAERAIDAYNLDEDSPHAPALRRVGALVMFHGIAQNGGLVGGGVSAAGRWVRGECGASGG